MRKIFTFIFALVASAGTLFADKVKIGDLYYNLNAEDKTAEVTYEQRYGYSQSTSNYLGLYVVDVPESVEYENATYSVTSIGDGAFGYSSLKKITLPSTVKRIGEEAFLFCGSLKTIHLPENVQTIDPVAFLCVEPSIDKTSFNYNSDFQSITVDENNKYFASKDGVLFNKSFTTLIAYPVGKTGNYTIPNTVESIEQFAFAYSCYLTKMIIPDNVLHIGHQAFCVMPRLDSVIVGNGVDRIPVGCFYLCQNLRYVSFGEKVKEISLDALYFAKDDNDITLAPLSTIVIYASQVPQIVKDVTHYMGGPYDYEETIYDPITTEDLPHVFENISRKAYLYVPGDAVHDYEMHSVWGGFDVRPITAQSAETSEVQISPSDNSVNITWPSVSGAATYELVIKDKSGNVVCTLIFNAQGQLISIAYNAPSRGGAPQHTQTAGFSFTVTGLEQGTSYNLTITAKDANGQELDKKDVTFHTESPEGIEDIHIDSDKPVKVLMDGQIYILRGEHVYDTEGKMVK